MIRNLLLNKSLLLQHLSKTLHRLAFGYLENCRTNLHFSVVQMQKLDIDKVLKRGFVLVKSGDKLLSSVTNVKVDELMVLEFYDGKLCVQVKGHLS